MNRRPALSGTSPASTGILQLVLSLDAGGTQRLVIELVRRLRHRFPMTICCIDGPGEWAADVEALGVEVIALRRRPGLQPLLAQRIAEIAESRGISTVHCHHYSPFVYGALARLLKPSIRVVFTEHGRLCDGAPSRKRRIANTVLARLPSDVCAVSADLRTHLIREGFADSVRVVSNGIVLAPPPSPADRTAARAALGLASDAVVVGTVGRLDPVKDLNTLLAAVSRWREHEPRARAVIIGDGGERQTLEAAIRRLDLTDHVVMAGHRNDVERLLPAFDVYVNSSIFEGVSLTVLEAMAACLPVVATTVGGNPEVVEDGHTGLLVQPCQPDELAEAIRRLMADPGRAAAYGRSGRELVERRFSIERMIADYEQLYVRPQVS